MQDVGRDPGEHAELQHHQLCPSRSLCWYVVQMAQVKGGVLLCVQSNLLAVCVLVVQLTLKYLNFRMLSLHWHVVFRITSQKYLRSLYPVHEEAKLGTGK